MPNCFFSSSSGASSVAKAWTGAFDDLIDNIMAEYLEKYTMMDLPGFSSYPDFFAAGLIMLLTGDTYNFILKDVVQQLLKMQDRSAQILTLTHSHNIILLD